MAMAKEQAAIQKDNASAMLDEANAMQTAVETERLSYQPIAQGE